MLHLFSYVLYYPIFIICQELGACSLRLGACSLRLQAIKKFPAAFQITGRQCAMVLCEPWQQIIMFNFLHLISSSQAISLSLTHAMPRNGAVPSRLLPLQQDGFMYMMYSGENTFGSLGVGMEEVMEAAVAEGLVEVASA